MHTRDMEKIKCKTSLTKKKTLAGVHVEPSHSTTVYEKRPSLKVARCSGFYLDRRLATAVGSPSGSSGAGTREARAILFATRKKMVEDAERQ